MRRALAVLVALALIVAPLPASAATGTHAPNVAVQYLNNSGDVCNGCLLFTYTAGTSTKVTTYTEVSLSSANTNPIVLDSAGRATIFLTPGISYKFVLAPSTDTDPPASPIWTRDNISAIAPGGAAADTDVSGTAGETITVGQVVYLSGGSGGATVGRWYLADSDQAYSSSTAAQLGIATVAGTAGTAITVRINGRITGLSGLVSGTLYYVSNTAGALSSSLGGSYYRAVGIADSTTTIVFGPWAMLQGSTVDIGQAVRIGGAAVLDGDLYIGNNIASDFVFPAAVVRGPWTYRPGDSTSADGSSSGRLAASVTDVANVNGAETTAYSYTLPADALDDAGDTLRVTVCGIAASNANTKTVNLELGAAGTVSQAGTMTYNGIHWCLNGIIMRVSSSSQKVAWCTSPDGSVTTNLCRYQTFAEDLTSALTLKVTLTGTASADITAQFWLVEAIG